MATPVGNPDISLLPQPSVPTPIEPMRGGGSEDVSLLPQPAAPAAIEPMRGGSQNQAPENVSLLPQPATPAPIVAMKGGGDKIPTLELVEFRRQFPIEDLKKLEVQLKVKEHITPYIDNLRRSLWDKQFPSSFDDSLKTFKTYTLDNSKPTVLFFIRDFSTFHLAEKNIRTQMSKNVQSRFVFVNTIKDKAEFSRCYKRFIAFVAKPEYRANLIFFLFDKTKLGIEWTKEEAPSKAKFLFLEPDALDFSYTEAGVAKHFLMLPDKTIPPEIKDNYIAMSPVEMPDAKLVLPKKREGEKEKEPLLVSSLKDKGLYSIDSKGKDTYFDSYYLYIRYKDIPTKAPPLTPPPKAAEPTPPPPPKPLEYIIKKKETVDFDLGGILYEIRKATVATQTEWEEGTFTDSEKALFTSLGLTDDFFKTHPSPEKEKLKAGRGKFLMSLTMSSCFKDMKYLLKSECEFVRDYLQSLLEIRQMERLRAVSEILGTFEDTAFTVIRSPASATAAAAGKGSVGAILENLNTLFKSFDFTRKSGKKPGADLNAALAASAGRGSSGTFLDSLNTLLTSFDLVRKSGKKPRTNLGPALTIVSSTTLRPPSAAAAVSAASVSAPLGIPEVQIDLLLSKLAPTKKERTPPRRVADIDFTDILTF